MKKMCPNLNKKWKESLARKTVKNNLGLGEGCVPISSNIAEKSLSTGSKRLPAATSAEIGDRSNKQQQQGNKEKIENRKKYACSNCKREFLYFKRALQCCKKVNRKFSFTCDKCKTVITNKQNVGRHKVRCANIMAMRSRKNAESDGQRKYTCELCGKDFDYKQSLKKHKISIHKMEKETGAFQCDLCTYSSDSKAIIKKHKTQVHPSATKQFLCDSCDSSFYSRQGLLSHKSCAHSYKIIELQSADCHYSRTNEAQSKQAETMHKDGVSSSETESDESDETESDENYTEDQGLRGQEI